MEKQPTSLSQHLWQHSDDLAQACLDHPFVQGIAEGSLDQVKFAYYVGQDAYFLDAFARAYSVAAAKAPDHATFAALHDLADGVLDELQLHRGYAAEWNVDLTRTTPGAATRRYTDFLLATAWGHKLDMILAAMTPCMRLYAVLGRSLVSNGIPDHRYADWLRTYSSPDFEALAQRIEDLLDHHGQPTPALETTYRYAMECEHDFFDAAWKITRL